jgi:periplasmic protein TonB
MWWPEEALMRQILAAALVTAGLTAVLVAQEVVNPGPGVTLPTVVKRVNPDYTPDAQRARIEGTVLLGVVILANGGVDNVVVERSLDPTFGLDQQAIKAMKQWEFKPGTKDGKPVAVRVHVEMTFTLK